MQQLRENKKLKSSQRENQGTMTDWVSITWLTKMMNIAVTFMTQTVSTLISMVLISMEDTTTTITTMCQARNMRMSITKDCKYWRKQRQKKPSRYSTKDCKYMRKQMQKKPPSGLSTSITMSILALNMLLKPQRGLSSSFESKNCIRKSRSLHQRSSLEGYLKMQGSKMYLLLRQKGPSRKQLMRRS